MKNVTMVLFCAFLSALILSGCENTVQGFGKDMQRTGQQIQKSVS